MRLHGNQLARLAGLQGNSWTRRVSEKQWECGMRAQGRDWARDRVEAGRGGRETETETWIDRHKQTQRLGGQGETQSLRRQKLK